MSIQIPSAHAGLISVFWVRAGLNVLSLCCERKPDRFLELSKIGCIIYRMAYQVLHSKMGALGLALVAHQMGGRVPRASAQTLILKEDVTHEP